MTDGVPGHLVGSVATGPDGTPVLDGRSFLSGHDRLFRERWGGWYATGHHGSLRHLGNAFTRRGDSPDSLEAGANSADLRGRFNTLLHLSGHSDIVALMVLEHQVTVHNALAEAAIEARVAEFRVAQADDAPDAHRAVAITMRKLAEPVVAAVLLTNEAPLPDAVTGSTVFSRRFASRGPSDARRRSLRELDLQQRLFTYLCSYLVYSRAFQELPPALKEEVDRQFSDALASGAADGPGGAKKGTQLK